MKRAPENRNLLPLLLGSCLAIPLLILPLRASPLSPRTAARVTPSDKTLRHPGPNTILPSAVEVCNGIDDDGNGLVDDGGTIRQVPSEYSTINNAISASTDGDEICVDPGTYSENIHMPGHVVYLIGWAGSASTTIDGGAADSCIEFQNTIVSGLYKPMVSIVGFTLTNGRGRSFNGNCYSGDKDDCDDGGAIDFTENADGALYLDDIVAEGNTSDDDAGAIYLKNATEAILLNVTLSGNTASDSGGGIRVVNSTYISLENVTFSDNVSNGTSGTGGGGLVSWNSDISLNGVTFEGNTAVANGGALLAAGGTSLDAVDVTVTSNTGSANGGGFYLGTDTVFTGTHLDIRSNSTSGSGGGIYFEGANTGNQLVASVVAGNQANGTGGSGLYIAQSCDLHLENIAVVGNSGSGASCGSIYVASGCGGSGVGVVNAILAYNGSTAGGFCSTSGSGALIVADYSDFYSNATTNWKDVANSGGAGIRLQIPRFVGYLSAAPATSWDLHLGLLSPLINTGSPTISDPDGSRSDMGAYGGPSGSW